MVTLLLHLFQSLKDNKVQVKKKTRRCKKNGKWNKDDGGARRRVGQMLKDEKKGGRERDAGGGEKAKNRGRDVGGHKSETAFFFF